MYATPAIQRPRPNVPLLRQTLAHVEALANTTTGSDGWYQTDYRCRRGKCYLAWAAELAGGRWVYPNPADGNSLYLIAEPDDDPRAVVTWLAEPAVSTRYRTQRVAGLTRDQAWSLSRPFNRLADLRRIVTRISEEAAA